MIESLIDTLAAAHEPRRHRELLTALWEQERWFDTPHQRRAAEIARDALAEGGLAEAALVGYAADGRTRWQDWTTHLAWDCPAGWLRLGEAVLADRTVCPQSVVYWSGPLAESSGEVVDGDALGAIGPEEVRGRFVLTGRPPREMKERLSGCRPVAVVSDYLGTVRGADEDTTKWCNTWADGRDGWYFRAADRVLPGFCLSPRQGLRLRAAMAAAGGGGVRLTGRCDSRLYAGSGQCVTGLLPGRDASREVWLFGHACEQGADDNCSGVSSFVEALRMLAGLVERGLLPRPRCGIRAIATEECLGMLAFAAERPELLRRAMTGMNVDCVSDATVPDRPFVVHYGPLVNPGFGWAVAGLLARRLAERNAADYHVRGECEPPVSDDMIADPACGVPTLWLGGSPPGYHSSADVPAACSDLSLGCNAVLIAAWAYAMADLDDRLAAGLMPAARQWIECDMLAGAAGDALRLRQWAAGGMIRDLGRWGVSPSVYGPAAEACCPAGAPPLPDLPTAGPRYARTTWGTCTLETLGPERTAGFSRWSRWQNTATFWTDGRRPLPAVERLTAAEAGQVPKAGLGPLFEAMVEADIARRV